MILWSSNEGDDNHLDTITRNRMTNSELVNNEFWIYLFMVLVIFIFGFVSGNIAHDTCCHVIEQTMN